MRFLTVCLIVFCVTSIGCQQAELEKTRAELEKAKAEVAGVQAGSATATAGKRLVHIVWFKLKEDVDQDALVVELNKLDGIDVVQDLEIGRFQDLQDPRAMSELDMVMQMAFQSEADYRTYQQHPVHVQLKQDVGQFIAGPPVTYDYWSE